MLIGKESVINYITLTKCKAFRVYRSGTSNRRTPIYVYEDAGGTEVCKHQFKEWAELNTYANPVEYSITVYPKGKPTGASKDAEGEEGGSVRDTLTSPFYLVAPNGFQVPQQNNLPVQQLPVSLGAASMETQEQMAARIRKEIEDEAEMDDLYDRLDEMEGKQTKLLTDLGKILGYVAPAFSGLFDTGIAALNGNTGVPAAAHLSGTETVGEEEVQRLNSALIRLRRNDIHICNHLEKLADISETKPAMFTQLLSMLDGI